MRVLLLAAALLAGRAQAETMVIIGGTVAIGDGSAPTRGSVVITDGRVVAAGPDAAARGAVTIVDATGKWVTPGLVAGFTRLGLINIDAVESTNDTGAARTPFNASLDVADAINGQVPAIAISRGYGVTRAIVAPVAHGSMFAGQGAVIDTATGGEAPTKPRAFQFIEFGETGAQIAGGSRPALFAAFRAALAEARDYARNPGRFEAQTKDAMLLRADAAALVPVIEGREPLMVHVESGTDVIRVLALKSDYPKLKLVLVGASEGWTVARRIAAAGVPVIASALNDLPAQFESLAATQSNIGRMKAAGVEVSVGMIGDDDGRMALRTTQYAGNLVAVARMPGATGLDWAAAFAAITSKPAEALGLGGEIGSLRPGRRADVVIWSGDPLELSSAPEKIWIDGVAQSLTTRQTRLRDRYLKPGEGNLPKAYER